MDESVPNLSVIHLLGVSPTNTLGTGSFGDRIIAAGNNSCERTSEWEKTTKSHEPTVECQ